MSAGRLLAILAAVAAAPACSSTEIGPMDSGSSACVHAGIAIEPVCAADGG